MSPVFNRVAKWAIFVLNRVGVWRPRRHSSTQSYFECPPGSVPCPYSFSVDPVLWSFGLTAPLYLFNLKETLRKARPLLLKWGGVGTYMLDDARLVRKALGLVSLKAYITRILGINFVLYFIRDPKHNYSFVIFAGIEWCAARFFKSWPRFQTKKCNSPHPFADQTSEIHTRFQTWPLGRNYVITPGAD